MHLVDCLSWHLTTGNALDPLRAKRFLEMGIPSNRIRCNDCTTGKFCHGLSLPYHNWACLCSQLVQDVARGFKIDPSIRVERAKLDLFTPLPKAVFFCMAY